MEWGFVFVEISIVTVRTHDRFECANGQFIEQRVATDIAESGGGLTPASTCGVWGVVSKGNRGHSVFVMEHQNDLFATWEWMGKNRTEDHRRTASKNANVAMSK